MKINFYARVQSFLNRSKWLSNFMPSFLHSCLYLIQSKINPALHGQATYKNIKFTFQTNDLSAVNEVLLDKEYQFLLPQISKKTAPVILDIGANIGTFCIWLLGENKHARMISIEPSKNSYSTLEKNIALSNALNWTAFKRAAWKNNDMISMSTSGDSMSHKVTTTGNEEDKAQGIDLKETINKALAQFDCNKIDVMKIDIEGSEESFLCGKNSIEANVEILTLVDSLVVELHPNYCDTDKVIAVLEKSYKHIENQTDRKSNKPLLYCTN